MADNRIRLPSSQAGITSFTDEYSSKFMISPPGALIFIAVFVITVIILRLVL